MVSILKDLDRLCRAPLASIHRCASVVGRIRSPLVALPDLCLFSDVLARHVGTSVYLGWDTEVPWSEALRDQLQQACSEMMQWKPARSSLNLYQSYNVSGTPPNGGGQRPVRANQMSTAIERRTI